MNTINPDVLVYSFGCGIYSLEIVPGVDTVPGISILTAAAEKLGLKIVSVAVIPATPTKIFIASEEGKVPCHLELAQFEEMKEQIESATSDEKFKSRLQLLKSFLDGSKNALQA